MYRNGHNSRTTRFAVCTAMSAVLLAGCAGVNPLARANSSYSSEAPSQRDANREVAAAESAVEKAPADASARIALAHAYLHGGRFESAVTTFDDAIQLGDGSARTWLSLSLAHIGAGNSREAVAILDRNHNVIPASDLGLALALAGETSRGVAILSDALRGGEDTPKLRQNLAYAYALDGRWREARLMAAQDVPAGQLDQRISDWAVQGRPEDYRQRVAYMLGAPVLSDSGQPAHLALNPTASPVAPAVAGEMAVAEPVAAQPSAFVPAYRSGELPPVENTESFWISEAARPELRPVAEPAPATPPAQSKVEPAPVTAQAEQPVFDSFDTTFAEATSEAGFVSRSDVQAIPAAPEPWQIEAEPVRQARTAPAPAPARVPAPANNSRAVVDGTHLVQLGSFSTPENAERAWNIFVSRNPELRDHQKVITQAVVKGRKYWRVSAAGFDNRSARSMCSSVKGRGGGCIAYAENNPLPGALPGTRSGGPMMARR